MLRRTGKGDRDPKTPPPSLATESQAVFLHPALGFSWVSEHMLVVPSGDKDTVGWERHSLGWIRWF